MDSHQNYQSGPEMVHFQCNNLERLVRRKLNRPSGVISPQDMLSLESIIDEAWERGSGLVVSLSGLEHATELKGLVLPGHNISDISPLAAITGLEEIDLQENRIYDLSPLQNLRKLKVLALNHNQITDITPIADSGYLIWLFLAYNFIKDVSPVENMENLQGLYIGDNPIQNPEVLETMEIDELHFFELKDEPILGHGEEELFEMEFLGLQNEL